MNIWIWQFQLQSNTIEIKIAASIEAFKQTFNQTLQQSP